jgi:predicted dehydrogenase
MSKKCTRRRFLKRTAAVGVALAIPTFIPDRALGANGWVAPSNRIHMASVGVGWQGAANMKNFLQKGEVQYVAVCDIDTNHRLDSLKSMNDHYGGPYGAQYHNYEDLFARDDLNAVCLSLPDHWHAIVAIAAARAGIDIYGEKPFSHNLREGRKMVDEIERNGRIWQTGSWQRSRANFHHAAELVRNGRIGTVRRVEVGLGEGYDDYQNNRHEQATANPPESLDYNRWIGPAPWSPYCPARVHKNWRWVMDHGGGKIMDWVGHHVDIAHWGLGFDTTGPVEVEGRAEYEYEGVWNAATRYECTATYANGVVMAISHRGSKTRWIGDDGWLEVSRQGIWSKPESVLKERISPDEIQLERSLDHYQNFLDAVRSRRLTITPAEVAHRSASVGHLCLIAIQTGRKIRWDPRTEQIVGDPDASRLLGRAYREPWQL